MLYHYSITFSTLSPLSLIFKYEIYNRIDRCIVKMKIHMSVVAHILKKIRKTFFVKPSRHIYFF